jgi:hypothetical protein
MAEKTTKEGRKQRPSKVIPPSDNTPVVGLPVVKQGHWKIVHTNPVRLKWVQDA